jgi:RNA-directed DNA polymerase
MEKLILHDIIKEAKDKADKFQLYHNFQHLNHNRNERRLIAAPDKYIKEPDEWLKDKKFNPFYVLKHKKQIARSIARKLLSGTYTPHPPFEKEIKKKGGGVRRINIYQIPDSAVSDRFYHNLLAKNKHRFSSLAYAYRNDRNIHFAIQDIASEIESRNRIYVAEFDFSDFFGSISHDYLYEQLKKNAFLVSNLELQVIESFLGPKGKGIPLGTSISLFLANLACWKLDRDLEDEGLRFARYADDTIIWSNEYGKIAKAFEIISSFSKTTGILINFRKSDGISILQKDGLQAEFKNSKQFVEFLGYKMSCDNISIKSDSVKNIKQQISYLLYRNLIQPLNGVNTNGKHVPTHGIDRDLVTAIMQIRRYLYGDITERMLTNYLVGANKTLKFKGIMSFYPLVNDEAQMKSLDAWLISTILNAVKLRKRHLQRHHPRSIFTNFPFDRPKEIFIEECKKKKIFGKMGLMQIPSFFRIHKAISKGVVNEGIERVMHPDSVTYYED